MENYTFFLAPVATSFLLAVMMACLGIFILWRRMIFVGIALSQSAGLGTVIGYICGINPFFSGLSATLLAVGLINVSFSEKVLHKDNINAFVYVFCSALTILLLVLFPTLEWGENEIFGGNLLYTSFDDLMVIIPFFILFLGLFVKMKRQWVILAIHDQENNPIKKRGQDRLFFILLAMVIALTSRWAGLLFTFGTLLFPALFVHLIAFSLKNIFYALVLFTLVITAIGVGIGFLFNLPLGIAVVICMGATVVITKLIKICFVRKPK